MAKVKSVFFCQNCGNESPKWIGKCPGCSEWNTYVEEKFTATPAPSNGIGISEENVPIALNDINPEEKERAKLADKELNRVLGGGLVGGSVTLLGGEPGIGKSTLLLQLAVREKNLRTLYISGEESASQIKLRAERLKKGGENCFIYTETDTQQIFREVKKIREPNLIIIDSVQTLRSPFIESAPGSVSQIRECTSEFIRFAKSSSTAVMLIGHITKDGNIAGPKVLEHMVDTVLQFEGDRNHVYRLVRSIKNRFGSTNELGIYEMTGAGLREVDNPSEVLISNHQEQLSGSAIAASMEGLRPMLIEIQALVSTAVYGTPQRSATGFDSRRLNMLLAVLEKRCGFKLAMKDVFLNMAGGVRVEDPAADLAVIAAILSSNEDLPLSRKTAFAAEVGLSGELRPVTRINQRIAEAQKLGFTRIFVSKYNKGMKEVVPGIEVVKVGKIEAMLRKLFG